MLVDTRGHTPRRQRLRWTRAWLDSLLVVLLSIVLLACEKGSEPTTSTASGERGEPPREDQRDRDQGAPDLTEYDDHTSVPTASRAELRGRAEAAADLRWLPSSPAAGHLLAGTPPERPRLLVEKQRSLTAADASRQARLNAVLASEAFTRASLVVRRWLDRRDVNTGLMSNPGPDEGVSGWFYEDTGSDLYPHVAIGTHLLFPDRLSEVVAVLAAERRLAPAPPQLPDDLLLPGGRLAGQSADERMFGAAEYAKDGLLPLVERLGRDPWLGRLEEIVGAILAGSTTPTHRGPIPGDSNEVNGDLLQVLTRTYWATGDERYYAAAGRIGTAYLDDMLPKTDWLPAHEWDFMTGEPIGRRRLRLSDHGNEIVTGLVEWHLAESLRREPEAPAHRAAIRKMLDRMLSKGRNPDGMWYRVMEIPSGKVDQPGLSDNWGYLFQAFVTQAAMERALPGGEDQYATRYEQAARDALATLPKYAYYPWQRGEMDGYADSIEGALYLLPRLPTEASARWVDEQIAVLFSFQAPDGKVEDDSLDGNFIRTSLLYGLSLTRGMSLDPWRPDLLVGAAENGGCVDVALASVEAWDGLLRFDTPRHSDHLRLPMDYARLNEWPEGFAVVGDQFYEVQEAGSPTARMMGNGLISGLPLNLEAGSARSLRVCLAS